MLRKNIVAGAFVAALIAGSVASAAPVRLARHPDYHAGKITFSYLGDIWTASEDGSERPSRHRQPGARGLPALLARRQVDRVRLEPLRQLRRVRHPRGRRHAQAADLPHRQRRGRRLVARRQKRRVPRRARRRRVPERRRRSMRSPAAGGLEKPLPLDWGFWGSYSPDGKSLVFNRHPAVWSRQHYRGSYAADLWIANLGDQHLHEAAAGRALQPLLADVGRRQQHLLRRRSAAQRQAREAGQPRRPQERQQHLQDSRSAARRSRCR